MMCMRYRLCAAWNKTKDKIRNQSLPVAWELAVGIRADVTTRAPGSSV